MIAQLPSSPLPLESSSAARQSLSTDELYRLTLYKWRYSLEACGFAEHEVSSLVFLKWLHCTRRVEP